MAGWTSLSPNFCEVCIFGETRLFDAEGNSLEDSILVLHTRKRMWQGDLRNLGIPLPFIQINKLPITDFDGRSGNCLTVAGLVVVEDSVAYPCAST